MSIAEAIQTALEESDELMDLLTGGIHIDAEEISRQNTPGAFDSTTKEIKPCALVKLGVEVKAGPHARSVRTPVRIYFYQRQGYDVINPAMDLVYDILNDQQIGERVWMVEFNSDIKGQRDQALDCALTSQIYNVIRHR